jgi:hypothetical protein
VEIPRKLDRPFWTLLDWENLDLTTRTQIITISSELNVFSHCLNEAFANLGKSKLMKNSPYCVHCPLYHWYDTSHALSSRTMEHWGGAETEKVE